MPDASYSGKAAFLAAALSSLAEGALALAQTDGTPDEMHAAYRCLVLSVFNHMSFDLAAANKPFSGYDIRRLYCMYFVGLAPDPTDVINAALAESGPLGWRMSNELPADARQRWFESYEE